MAGRCTSGRRGGARLLGRLEIQTLGFGSWRPFLRGRLKLAPTQVKGMSTYIDKG